MGVAQIVPRMLLSRTSRACGRGRHFIPLKLPFQSYHVVFSIDITQTPFYPAPLFLSSWWNPSNEVEGCSFIQPDLSRPKDVILDASSRRRR